MSSERAFTLIARQAAVNYVDGVSNCMRFPTYPLFRATDAAVFVGSSTSSGRPGD